MIKGLMGTQGVVVSNGNTSVPYVGPNANNPMTGMLRIHNTEIEAFNGSVWQSISSSYATVALDPETQDILQWARKKRDEELEIEQLAKDNIAINDLLSQIKEKQHQAKMIATLIKKEETV
jgi:cell shape-determining protein MreC